MKLASQTVSTKDAFFITYNSSASQQYNNGIQSKTINNESYKQTAIDFSIFKSQLNKLQQKVIREQIEKYESLNLQKQFPPLLKKLQQKSEKLINLENKFNNQKEKFEKEFTESKRQQTNSNQEKQALEETLFNLESSDLLKQQYQKQFILSMIDNFQIRIRHLMEDRHDLQSQKQQLSKQKLQLTRQIQNQKQSILQAAIKKSKILQELDFVKNCQIIPIHLIRQKSVKSLQSKVNHFQGQFNPYESQGLIEKYCKKYEQLTQKQFGELVLAKEKNQICNLLKQQQKIVELQNKLNTLTSRKLQQTEQINIEALKNKLIYDEIEQKEKEIIKYQQLLDFVNNQHFCVENVNQNGLISNEVMNTLQLQEKVSIQIDENEVLRKKLKQLKERLDAQKQANLNLNRLLSQVKKDHQIRTQKMLIENKVLKSNLETKKVIYGERIQSKQNVIDYYQITKSSSNKNQQEIKYQQSKPIQQQKKTIKKEQDLQQKLNELRARLMRKFQAAENLVK